ncbi:MGM101 [Candida pseudojiufengensis]|uniref:MGM101 n=1 Tax=Candida pseudojiufengensis TaxID=497109 RepID=UPI0022257DC7|nr:MGM101 [Candida pseudojiufengensis]KAI5960298.1 MGM101 [Candida pseudojiufengensis]
MIKYAFQQPIRRVNVFNTLRLYSRYTKAASNTTTSSSSSQPIKKIIEDEDAEIIDTPVSSNSIPSSITFNDSPIENLNKESTTTPNAVIDWSDSYHGLGSKPFSKEISDILLAPIDDLDIEIKPDGLLYLPEIKYRRILNKAFGPGGWGLVPRTSSHITKSQISREFGLICHGRLISIARGEQDYFGGEEKITTALEGCKSNALMRCCKDLGIASELWDPSFIRKWKSKYCEEVFAEHVVNKKKKKLWKLKSLKKLEYPYKQI